MGENQRKMESWGTRIGVILAVTGSAVGLGNFLRFPGLAGKYEGGAFMIPYFVALLLLGFPLAWAEWAMGRYGGTRGFNSSPGIYRAVWGRRKWGAYIGVIGVLVPVGIFMYYMLIEAWCLAYAWFYLNGTMADMARQAVTHGGVTKTVYIDFFNKFVGLGSDGALFGSDHVTAIAFVAICFVANFIIIYRGLSKGIEKFCLWAMPALVVCGLIVLVRVLTLNNIVEGLGFMWNPRTEKVPLGKALANPTMWLEATGQIFFTLSVGFGIIITYASYLKPNDDVALSGLTSCAGNEFCEVGLGGMITIPAAFIFLGAQQVTEASGSSFNLGFKTLPMVFQSMHFGYVVGFLFFFLLFLAAITSSLSMLQPAIALLEEGLGMGRKTSVAVLGFITLVGMWFVAWFSKDLMVLDTFDFWVGSLLIVVLATFQAFLFGWVMGPRKGMAEIDRGAEIRVPRIIGYLLKYVSPFYLLLVLGFWLWTESNKPREENRFWQILNSRAVGMSVVFLAALGVFFLLLIMQSVKRWEKREAAEKRQATQ